MTRNDLLNFLRQHTLAVQATVSPTNTPQAAVIGFMITDNFEIFFDSITANRKVGNLRSNPGIAFAIGGLLKGDERTAQYEGVADEPVGSELTRLQEMYFTRFPEGRERQGWSGIVYFRARPKWIRYSDYSQNPPQVVEFNFVP
jgi:Pyridoxamine 5'-phosphate oxidase